MYSILSFKIICCPLKSTIDCILKLIVGPAHLHTTIESLQYSTRVVGGAPLAHLKDSGQW